MFVSSDRILLFAPHPDDESLATGGLLMRAFNEGIPTRLVYMTNGDNNPWAQRYCERRWSIGFKDRMRWGKRRKEEALSALEVLGGDESCVRFLDLPDQGVTDLLMHGIRQVMEALRDEIRGWRPTYILQPAAEDAHPDHSALHVILSIVRATVPECDAATLNYIVHRWKAPLPDPARTLQLAPSEVERKLRAILKHETQVAASRKRFTGYARPEEFYFDESSDFLLQPPINDVKIRDGVFHLEIEAIPTFGKTLQLFLVLQTETGDSVRWSLAIPKGAPHGYLKDEMTGSLLHAVPIQWKEKIAALRLLHLPPLQSAFVKTRSQTLFFDKSGWIRVPKTDVKSPSSSEASATATGIKSSLVVTSFKAS